MTRHEAIAAINAKIESLGDEDVEALAELVKIFGSTDGRPRHLTKRELELIENSRRDFVEGRTLSAAEARAATDNFLAGLGVPRSRG